jgi:hypothetical protein
MNPLTRDDVINVFGQVDDIAISEILSTGATPKELAEAQAWLSNDQPLLNTGRSMAPGRVNRLIEILEDIDEQEADPEQPA